MEHLVETRTNNLWPFGSDKRMLFAIYAHFNTMIQKQDCLHLAAPISQKIQTIHTNIKSLIQVITGMTKIDSLQFELPSLLANTACASISGKKKKKKVKKRKRSKKGARTRSKTDGVINHIRNSIKQSQTTSKLLLSKKHSSQTVVIYDDEALIQANLSTNIIKDYHETVDTEIQCQNHQYSASFDAANAEAYRKTINMRNDLSKIIHKPQQQPKPASSAPLTGTNPMLSVEENTDNMPQRPPPPPPRKPSVRIPPAKKSMAVKVKATPKLVPESLSLCLEQYNINLSGSDKGLITFLEKYLYSQYLDKIYARYGIEEISNINQLTDILTVCIILYKAKVFQINSSEKGIEHNIDKQKIKSIAKYLATWIVTKYGDKMDNVEVEDEFDCIDLTAKDFLEKIHLYLQAFVDENKMDVIKTESIFNAEPYGKEQEDESNSSGNGEIALETEETKCEEQKYDINTNQQTDPQPNKTRQQPPPPLPRKSDKTVTLQTVRKTWKLRRQRPLPQPGGLK